MSIVVFLLLILLFVCGAGFGIGLTYHKLIPLIGVLEIDEDKMNMIWMLPIDEVYKHDYIQLKVTQKKHGL